MVTAKKYTYGLGRRKSATASARLYPGKGELTINGKPALDYFCQNKTLVAEVTDSLAIAGKQKEYLILITPRYLMPYLNHVKNNKLVYEVSAKYPVLMKSNEKYKDLQTKILFPIFKSFGIDDKEGKYISAYYINGVYAIIDEWIKGGCVEDESDVCNLIIKCVRPL